MPALELPPSFSDDEIMRSFGAPGTSLSNSSGGMMMAKAAGGGGGFGGYAASCPAPSFMMSAAGRRPLRTNADGSSSSGGGGGGPGGAVDVHGAGATADAQTPSFNSLVGSRTALSVLMEVDESAFRDDDGGGGGGGVGSTVGGSEMAPVDMMKNIKLESIDLGGPVSGVDDEDGNISSDGYDGGGLFAMED